MYAVIDELLMRVRDILEIINFTYCRTPLYFNKYGHEHTFSVSPVCQVILRNSDILCKNMYVRFLKPTMCCFSFYVLSSSTHDLESYYSF